MTLFNPLSHPDSILPISPSLHPTHIPPSLHPTHVPPSLHSTYIPPSLHPTVSTEWILEIALHFSTNNCISEADVS